MGKTPKQWSSQEYVLRRTFKSDQLAVKDGYSVEDEYYILEDERIPRKRERFSVCATGRILHRGWVRIQIKIPVIYGEPWKEDLKQEIERELKTNYDLVGVFLNELDPQWCRGFEISWND